MTPNQNAPRRPRLDRLTLFFIAVAAASAGGLWMSHGASELASALSDTGWLLLGITPIIALAILIGGYVQALLPRNLVSRWFGEGSGVRGYLLAASAGALTPAGPFAAFPLVIAMSRAGASFDVCVVYVTGWATLGINRIVIWELPFLGPDFVLLRLIASAPLPFIAGFVARWLARSRG